MKYFKKASAFLLAAAFAAIALTACGKAASQPASSAPSSIAPASSASASSAASGAASSKTEGSLDVAATAQTLAEAANLGVTIKMVDIDLVAGGVDTANVEEFAGLQSQNVAENGGMVIVIRAKAGTAATVASQLEGYRDFQTGNEDYAEFEAARTNIKDARIQTFGDYVVYAVSATGQDGGWATLDTAITDAFAGVA